MNKMDASEIMKMTNHFAENHMDEIAKGEYVQACNIIAEELEKHPETAKEKFQKTFLSGLKQDVKDYHGGLNYAVDGEDFVETMKRGRALRMFEENNQILEKDN